MTSSAGLTKGLFMSVKNQMEYDVLSRAIRGEMTGKQASAMIGKSYRQTKRLIAKVRRPTRSGS